MKNKLQFFLVLTILCFLSAATRTQAQITAGEDAKVEYRYLIDMPVSGILDKGLVAVSNDIMPNGILIARLEVGAFENISFGISYGGANIIGSGSPTWYKLPAASFRFKMLKENLSYPSLTIGFDTQGKGVYFDSSSRYEIKSPGLFLNGSKNFSLMGFLTVHGCLNYSFETTDGDNFINLSAGAEKTIGARVSVISEYNFALNDNNAKIYGNGRGYLNIGVRWAPADGFTVGFDLRDMLSNKKWTPGGADRAIHIEYMKAI
jgi:hypothetical protein